MRTNILLSLSITFGSVFAYDTCLTESSWNDCVSTRRDAALSTCLSASTLPLSLATPLLASCDCSGFDINYSCAKTYCAGHTSLQSEYLDSYSSCTSFVSNPFGVVTTETVGASTFPATQTSSSAGLVAGGSSIPTSTTTSSSASNTPPTIATTSALGTTANMVTSQPSSTTSTNDASASLRIPPTGVFGWLLVFLIITMASVSR